MRCQSRTTKLVAGENGEKLHDTKRDDASDVVHHFKSDQNFSNVRCVIYGHEHIAHFGAYGTIGAMVYKCIVRIHSSIGDKTNEM